jgi:hypothetical protein
MRFSEATEYAFPTVVRHQGVVIVLALDEKRDIYYRVLALDPAQVDDDKNWTDRKKLAFPSQVRPAGMSVVTVDLDTPPSPARAPFQAVSDGKHVYLFRQSTAGTLYVDRFVYYPALKALNRTWETRFQRSQKRDLAASRKDTFGAKNMESQPFLEPTTDLHVVKGLTDGRFCVLLLPGPLPTQWRWHVWAVNVEGQLDSLSIGRGEDGLFNMADVQQIRLNWSDVAQRFQAGPAALMYMQQEDAKDEYGRPQRVKRGARVMLAAPVGFSRYALELDGTDDYVMLGNPPQLQISGAITLEAWVKPGASQGEGEIVAHGASGVALRIRQGHFQVGAGDHCAAHPVPPRDPKPDTDPWIHVAGTYADDGPQGQGVWSLFLDGQCVAQEPDPTGPAMGDGEWTIGRYFAGTVNNVRLWGIARSAEEIAHSMHRRLAGDEPGLLGNWPCDEGCGSTVRDQAGTNHGQLCTGYVLALDGATGFASIPDHDAINLDQDEGFTVTIWVQAAPEQKDRSGIDNMIVEKWSGQGGYPYAIRYLNRTCGQDAGKIVARRYDGNRNPSIVSTTLVNDGKFHHIAFVKDGSSLLLYVDGFLEGTAMDTTAGTTRNESPLYVGVRAGRQYPFSGQVRDLRLWNRALSLDQVEADMGTRARDVVGAVGNWAFGEGTGEVIAGGGSGQVAGRLCHIPFLSFDGLDDHVALPATEPMFDKGFTVEAWVRYRSFGSWSRILDLGNGASADNVVLANEGTTNNLIFCVFRGAAQSSLKAPAALQTGVWMHLAATVDEVGNAALYKDGQLLVKGRVHVPTPVRREGNYIGRSNWESDGHFDGDMGGLRIWSLARRQDQIQRDIGVQYDVIPPGLAVDLPFDQRAGDAVDNRASGSVGHLCTGFARDTHALFLNGVGDHVELPAMNLDLASGCTIEAWVHYRSFRRWSRIIDLGLQAGESNVLLANRESTSDLVLQVYQDRTGSTLVAPGVLKTGAWMHLAATIDAEGNGLLYVNGRTVASGKLNPPGAVIAQRNHIGRSNWAGDGTFDGGLQQVRLWNIARSPDEIAARMNDILQGDEPGLVGYWPLDEGSGLAIRDAARLVPHHGRLKIDPKSSPDARWAVGPIPRDNPDRKWSGGSGTAGDRWRAGREEPDDKWQVLPALAILDFGLSRDGTLALLGDMQDGSEMTLALDSRAPAAAPALPIPRLGAGAGEAMPLSTITVDKRGLTISGGLLDLARSGEAPFLLDGTDGLIHLYFRGEKGTFFVAQHDTLTARAEYTLPLDGDAAAEGSPRLHFTARRPGPEMEGYEIAIANDHSANSCRVTMDGPNGIREWWQNVPRNLDSFLAVLNGAATSDASDPQAQEGGTLVYYDYAKNVQRHGIPDHTSADGSFRGSALFAAWAEGLPDTGAPQTLPNVGTQTATSRGQTSAWIPEPEGKALKLDGIDDHVALVHDRLPMAGDLTVETWVKVAPALDGSHPMRLLTYRCEGVGFALGLDKDANGRDYKVLAQSGSKGVRSTDAHVTPERWTHLAAVYNATNALQLDGQGYVDCGNASSFNQKAAMTVEAWVTLRREGGQRLQPEVILSKWGATEEDQSWRLYIDTDDRPCFETRDSQRRLLRVRAGVPLVAGRSYHLAGAFDASPQKETCLKFDGGKNYVALGNPDELDFRGAITIAAWVNVRNTTGVRNIIAHGAGGVFLRVQDGKVQVGVGSRAASYALPSRELGAWIHLAGVYDQGRMSWLLFRNGVEVAQEPDPMGAMQVREDWSIGRSFAGEMNNVRIWRRSLSREEIGADMDKPALKVEGAEGNWAFDQLDALTGSVQDHSRGNTGTLQGGLSAKSFAEADKGRYQQRIWVNGELCARRWIAVDGERGQGCVAREGLAASVEARAVEVDRQVAVGDQLLLQDEQMLVARVEAEANSTCYRLEVERAINGIVREHKAGTEFTFLKRGTNQIAVSATRLNIGRSASDQGYFRGIIDDVRLWEAGRRDWQIQYCQDGSLPEDEEGLAGDWRFEEGRGSVAGDAKGSNHGRLVHPKSGEVELMWTPVARNAELTLYVNGRPVQTAGQEAETGDPDGQALVDQLVIGALLGSGGSSTQHLSGSIDEVRVWNQVRRPEQIADNMYRSLTGGEEGLVGYWPLDEGAGSSVDDQTANGQNGVVQGGEWVSSTAPLGNEGPEVRNVCGGLEKPGFNRQIAGAPAAVEYSDMQWDEKGDLSGVMKRCYVFQDDGLQLVTGFKVGDLELSFVGQVQTAPTLIGYIEGAPPVPSENLTVNDAVTDDYVGTSTIRLTEAEETAQIYSASRDTGFDMSVDVKAGVHWAIGVEAGMFVAKDVLKSEGKVGAHAYFEHSTGWLSGATITAGTSKTLSKSLTLGGGWEEPQGYDRDGQPRYLNPEVGRRYLPNNVGYALVKSATADLFALRLKRTGSLVAFQVMPNPGIPEDWNVIMFPINPKYVKNGTLDGMVGMCADPDYPEAIEGARGSYFKPLEAYALKKQIEKEAEDIRAHFTNFKAGEIGRRTDAVHFQQGDPGDASRRLADVLPEQELGYDWKTGQDRRNMVNTYVWTADGGFYAEEEQYSSIRQESWGGSYHFLGKAGVYLETKFAAGIGFFGDLDALFGGHINVEVQKSLEEKRAFGVHVEVQGEGFINRWDRQKACYTTEACPGKVDAYRFMTFYLAPSSEGFDRFFDEVVDPEWLNGQGRYAAEYGPNARALREARSKSNEVWRVLHRVTYVSRISGPFAPTPTEVVRDDVRRPANVEANLGLIREIERIKRLLPASPRESRLLVLGRAVDRLLFGEAVDDCPGQSELEHAVSWWAGRGEGVKREVRQDVVAYVKAFYESDLVPPRIEEKQRVRDGLQVLYTFEEGTGTKVSDVSGVGTPLDLAIGSAKAVRWLAGGLAITGNTFVATPGRATKLITAVKDRGEITIEAWVRPANTTQSLACIVSLGTSDGFRSFALRQERACYQVLLRTSQTDHRCNGSALTIDGLVSGEWSHVAYTRDKGGTARYYLNGTAVGQRQLAGDLSNWNVAYRLGLGNQVDGDQPWKGDLNLLAIYNRALDPAEVAQNYWAGPGMAA